MAVCLVTGGAGFIGSHLVEALAARNHQVRVLDNLSCGLEANLNLARDQVDFIRGDISDLAELREAMRGVELVFHHAALAPTPSAGIDPLFVHSVGATGTLNVLQAAREAQVRRVIFAGSASVYRADDDRPRRETDPTGPRSLYAIAKLTAEDYCKAFGQIYGLETVCLRYFHVFGPRQPATSAYCEVVTRFLQTMGAGRRPVIRGDGQQTRDFTHVSDVIQANLLAADAPRVAGKVFNIATGQPTSLVQLADAINQVLGTKLLPIHEPSKGSDPLRYLWADIVQAETELGYCPCTDLVRDLASCLEVESPAPRLAETQVRWDDHAPISRRHGAAAGQNTAVVESALLSKPLDLEKT